MTACFAGRARFFYTIFRPQSSTCRSSPRLFISLLLYDLDVQLDLHIIAQHVVA